MARLLVFVLTCAVAPACDSKTTEGDGGCRANDDCAPGEACISGECQTICRSDGDCDSGFICVEDTCIEGARTDAPVITGVDADGIVDSDPSHVAHRIDHRLTIQGEHLEGAGASLSDGTTNWDLDICDSSDAELVVALPQGLTSGSYLLTVATQAGACETTLPVLQGEQGPIGAQGPAGAAGAPGATGDAGGGLALSLELAESGGPSSFADSSPYGNTATLAGPGGVTGGATGHTGFGVSFSGGVLTIGSGNTIPDSPMVWVEAWVEPQDPLDVSRVVVMKENAFALKQVNENVSFTVTASGGDCTATSSGDLLSSGTWSHLSGWYDGLSVVVVIDGVVRARTACSQGPMAPSAPSAVHVGGDLNGTTVTEDYKGIIDSVRIWHVAPRWSGNHSNIVNLTIHSSSTRRVLAGAATIEMESFTVDKKSPTSFLLIEGTISGHGNAAGSMNQGWTYGTGTEVIAQSIMYDENAHGRIFSTTAVIAGHTTTGPQDLVFRYFTENSATGNRPFITYNPNSTTDPRLGQTQSIYKVWEIEPAY